MLSKKTKQAKKTKQTVIISVKTSKRTNKSEIAVFFICDNFMFEEIFNGGNPFAVKRMQMARKLRQQCRVSVLIPHADFVFLEGINL